MKSVKCPSCEKYTPGDRDSCLGCGSSLMGSLDTLSQIEKLANNQKSNDSISTQKPSSSFTCSKCGSEYLTGNKKGFGLGKAVVGGLALGGLGLFGGFFGAGKVKVTCMECGHSWKAGQS